MFKDMSILKIKEALITKRISVRELMTECVKPDRYNAFEWFDPDILYKYADKAQKNYDDHLDRPLEGIPVAVKDIINTEDYPTQMGSPIWKGFTPGNDARCVFNLKRAGAIIAGKTVTAEFAVHTLGKTLNPYDIRRNPGTSSSGSAVAVAAGLVPAAIGTQTAGSIVRPASYCGVIGVKPSFGLIPRTGILKTCDTMDTVGFFINHITDINLIHRSLAVRGQNYPNHRMKQRNLKKEKTVFVKTHTYDGFDYRVKNYFEAARMLGQKTVELPEIMNECHKVHATIYNKSLSYYFRAEYQNKTLVSDTMNELIEAGMKINTEEYLEALNKQEQIIKAMDRFFELNDCDLIISASTAGPAPLRSEREKDDPALMWTMAHLPVVSLPALIIDGLPCGLQCVGRKYYDESLFNYLIDCEVKHEEETK